MREFSFIKFNNCASIFIFIVLLCISCKTEYEKYVEQEISKNVRNDSLFLGFKFGMPRSKFFEVCWHLNNQHIVNSGTGANVEYIEKSDSNDPKALRLIFYGIFDEKTIMRGMDMKYNYLVWSPWLKDKDIHQLIKDVKSKMLKEYGGNDFIEMRLKQDKIVAYVKIDGNRQILVYPKNSTEVVVKIEDLNYKLNKR